MSIAAAGSESDSKGERLANYWHVGVPDFMPSPASVRSRYDAIVVGGGYSGLATAWGLARHGRSVLVLEENAVGFGASSRNGGMVGPSFHQVGMAGLTRKYGAMKAASIMRVGMDALAYSQELISTEKLDCEFQATGRFRGARSQSDLRAMVSECERLNKAVGLPYEVVSQSDLFRHIGSNAYKGGVYYPDDGGLQPKRLANALAFRAESAGAQILLGTPACGITRDGNGGFSVATPKGVLASQQVVIATNGYSGQSVRLMSDRIVPIDVSVAATRHLGKQRVREMSPRLQMHGESGRVFIWSRPSPDRERFIFGGRLSRSSAAPEVQRGQIATAVQRIYPELKPSDFEFIWNGKIAYTVDHSPHLAKVDGVWMIGGYCGSGVTRSLYFSEKLVRKIVGRSGSDTPFDDLGFPRVDFRKLAPLGARILTKYYGVLDNIDAWRKS